MKRKKFRYFAQQIVQNKQVSRCVIFLVGALHHMSVLASIRREDDILIRRTSRGKCYL